MAAASASEVFERHDDALGQVLAAMRKLFAASACAVFRYDTFGACRCVASFAATRELHKRLITATRLNGLGTRDGGETPTAVVPMFGTPTVTVEGQLLRFPVRHQAQVWGEVIVWRSADHALNSARWNAVQRIVQQLRMHWHNQLLACRLDRAQRQLARLRRRARASIRAREDVLAMASHDLRTPLGIISLKAASLRHAGALDALQPGIAAELDAILRHVQYMERLIGDLLDLGQLRAGKLGIVGQHEDLAELLDLAIESIRPVAGRRVVALETSADGRGQAICDRQRMLQVMANLLGNAIKFTEPRGRIRVRLDGSDDYLHVAVQDDGRGIPPDALPYIFRRYWHAGHMDGKSRGHGTGLGLFIARSIIKAHGGQMWVRSELGNGTTFHFTLPRAALATLEREASAGLSGT